MAENNGGTAKRGRPFEKGRSGNPGGRPKGFAKHVREVIGEDADAIVGFWTGVLTGEVLTTRTTLDSKGNATNVEHVMEPVTISDRIAVSKLLAERGWGKPAEFIPIEDADPLDSGPDMKGLRVDFDGFLDELAAARRERESERAAGEREDEPTSAPEQAE